MDASRARRVARCASALLVFGALLRAGPAAAQQDTGFVELGVQVQIEGGPSRLLVALARDSTILVPVRQFLHLIEIRVTRAEAGRRLEALLAPENVPFGFDTERRQAFKRREVFALPDTQAVWQGEELYVATDVLALILDVEFTLDWSELLLGIARSEALPVVSRLARERRREVLLRPPPPPPPEASLRARRALADGLVLDWAATSSSRDSAGAVSAELNSVQLGLGAQVLGGGLDLDEFIFPRASLGDSSRGTKTETHWSWVIAWPSRSWIRQARAGEIVTGGPRARSVRGLALTNAPFLRPAEFGGERLGGRLAPGWEVELYRAEQLVGFSPVDSSGRYLIDVPVIYGPNPLEYVAYGPGGEVVRRGRTFQVPFERLGARRLEYSVGGGECLGDPCAYAANADLRYGFSNRLTLEAGLDRFWRDSLPDLSHPYALASMALTRSLSLTVEGVSRALARARFDYDPHTDFHLDVGHIEYDSAVVQPIIGSTTLRRQTDATLFWRPGAFGGAVFFQASASRGVETARTRDLVRASVTARVLGLRLTAAARDERDHSPGGEPFASGGADVSGDALVTHGARWLRTMLVHIAAASDCGGGLTSCDPSLARISAGFGRQIAGGLRLDLGVARERGRPGVQLDVAVSTTMSWLRASTRSRYARDVGASSTQLWEGSVLWDRRSGRLELGNGRNLGRSGLSGVVFLDRNANGERDGDEPGIGGVQLRVGADAVVTDSLGRFTVWGLVPFESALIEIDTLTLQNPLWVPAAAISRMRPSPSSFQLVALPILEGGEIGGRVAYGDRETPLAGARLILRNVATGAIHEITTFTDGTFYTLGIRPGEYYLTLPAALEEELAAQAVPLHFTIGGPRGSTRLEGLVLRVEAVARHRR